MIDVNSIIQFINIIRSLVAESQNNGELDTVADQMSQAWLNTLESLYIRLNPGLIRRVINIVIFRIKMIYYIFTDSNGVTRSKSNQTIGVFHKYFSQLNIDEKIFQILTEQCKKLKETQKSPFQNITDKELISLLDSNAMQEHIISFIKKTLKNKTELLSFLQEHNQTFFDAFRSHFYAIVNYEKINTIMNQIQCKQLEKVNQQLEQQNQQLEKLTKNKNNLVEKTLQFYEISVKLRDSQSRGKKGKQIAYCYSQYGKYVLMAGSYVTLNPTDKCPDNILKLREQYANCISDDGLILKAIPFTTKVADTTIVNFVNYSQENGKKPRAIQKKYKKFFQNADNEWEFDIYNKNSKKNS